MAAPEEQDLTQEQTEKLLQFQVAASPRRSRCRRGLGSGPPEEPRTFPKLGARFSGRQAAPSPRTPTAPLPRACVWPAPLQRRQLPPSPLPLRLPWDPPGTPAFRHPLPRSGPRRPATLGLTHRGCLTPTVEVAALRVPGTPLPAPHCYLHTRFAEGMSWVRPGGGRAGLAPALKVWEGTLRQETNATL